MWGYWWEGLTFLALRGLTLEALACLNFLPGLFFLIFLIFLLVLRCAPRATGFLGDASTTPATPQLNARASANVRSRMFVLSRTGGEPQVHL